MIVTTGLHGVVGVVGDTDSPADFTYVGFGSGTAAVTAADSTLGTQTQRVLATMKIKSILKPNDTEVYTGVFTATADGTLTEVGLFTESSGGTMLLRRLTVKPHIYLQGAIITVTVEVTVENSTCGTGATW